jgi:hypothetical protein
MKKITKTQAQIAQAHLMASIENNFDADPATSDEMRQGLIEGKKYMAVHKYIVGKHISVTSQLMASPQLLGHLTNAYIRDYKAGFKLLLNQLKIA